MPRQPHPASECDELCSSCCRCYLESGETSACSWLCEHRADNWPDEFWCDRCQQTSADVEAVETIDDTAVTACQTHASPAEYEQEWWCRACRDREAYVSDPWNRAYERLRASGWPD